MDRVRPKELARLERQAIARAAERLFRGNEGDNEFDIMFQNSFVSFDDSSGCENQRKNYVKQLVLKLVKTTITIL